MCHVFLPAHKSSNVSVLVGLEFGPCGVAQNRFNPTIAVPSVSLYITAASEYYGIETRVRLAPLRRCLRNQAWQRELCHSLNSPDGQHLRCTVPSATSTNTLRKVPSRGYARANPLTPYGAFLDHP